MRNYLDRLSSGIKSSISGARSWVKNSVTSAISSTVNDITESIVNHAASVTEKKVKSSIESMASQLGLQSLKNITHFQSTLEKGISKSGQTTDEIIAKFDSLMKDFRISLDKKHAQKLKQEQEGETSATPQPEQESFLNLEDGEKLYRTLEDLGNSFKTGKLKLEAFANQGKTTIENAKPRIESMIGKAFVDLLFPPLLQFFKGLVTEIVKSVFQDISNGSAKPEKALDPRQPSKGEAEVETEAEATKFTM